MNQQKNTLTLVDSYGHVHTIYDFATWEIEQAMKDIVNILRYAGFSDTTITKGLDIADLDF